MNRIDLYNIMESMAFEGKEYEEIESEIRKYKGLISETELKSALSSISEYIAAYQMAKQQKANDLNHIFIGITLLLLGVIFTVGTFFSGSSSFIITFGLLIGGAFIIYNGIKEYNKPLHDVIRKKQNIQKKILKE